jgi:hypothetical protein
MRCTALAAAPLLALVTALDAQVAPAPPAAPAASPDTEIWIADLVRAADDWRVERPRNVTKRSGYDNQPWFLPDGERLLYTSLRAGQADVFELDLATASERRVTATPESEYSPQLALDGQSVVVVRVESDGTQRLWRFPLDGKAPEAIAPAVTGVGYHAWLDAATVAVFVLGEPPTLRIVEVATGAARVVANGIGRSLHREPGSRRVTLVAPEGDSRSIFAHDPATGSTQRLAPAPPNEEGDYAWTPGGILLAAAGAKLFRAIPGPGAAWTEIADLAGDGVGKITRIAVSPLGTQLAFVADR